MRTFPKWLLHLLPSRERTFGQRFIGILVTWGIPILIWETLKSGVLRTPSQWSFFLTLELPATILGVLVYTVLEHVFYRSLPKRDYR
jgi:hypothetical protein